VGENGFVRIEEPKHQHEGAPAVNGTNSVLLGPELPGRIAVHEAAALRLADSLSMRQRCP
jgi:hypothetical protein